MAQTLVMPAAIRYLNELLVAAEGTKAIGLKPEGKNKLIGVVNDLVNELAESLDELVSQNAELGGESVHSKAHHMRDNIVPAMTRVRSAVDKLEKLLPDDLWPLPRYREMLFVR
jgi:glutamine synthetase